MAKKKSPAYGITAVVELTVEKEFIGSKAKLLKALKGAFVKVKSGPLENLAMGSLTEIKEVRDETLEWEE